MRYKAKANGNVIHMSDEAAAILVPSIYERVSDDTPLTSELNPPIPPPVEKKPEKGSSTAVKPLTTADMPKAPKKGKPIK